MVSAIVGMPRVVETGLSSVAPAIVIVASSARFHNG
jgi:hypothetical protein